MITLILFFATNTSLVPWWLWCAAGVEVVVGIIDRKIKEIDK